MSTPIGNLATLTASNAIFNGTNQNDIALYSFAGQSIWIGCQGQQASSASNFICVSSNNTTLNGGITAPTATLTSITASNVVASNVVASSVAASNMTSLVGAFSNITVASNVISSLATFSNVTTSNIVVTGNVTCSGNVSAGNIGMFRNRIINGDMAINQRGNSTLALTNVSTGATYFMDRFRVNHNITGTITLSLNALTTSDAPYQYGIQSSYRITNTNVTAYTWIEPGQIIEGYNIKDFNWGTSLGAPITVSFWFRTNGVAGSVINVIVRNGPTNTMNYITNVTITSANTWQYCKATIPPPPIGTTWSIDNGDGLELYIGSYNNNVAGAANAWVSANPMRTSSSTDILIGTGKFVEFTGVQLEKGTMATPFEFRPYPIELQLCQRYYIQYIYGNQERFGYFMNGSGTVAFSSWTLPVLMRVRPSVSCSSSLNANGTITSIDNGYGFSATNTQNLFLSCVCTSTSGSGWFFSNAANQYISFSAEL